MWKLICEMGGNMRVKSLDAYDIITTPNKYINKLSLF